jgi:hypothetical protein
LRSEKIARQPRFWGSGPALNAGDPNTYYDGGENGYTNYPLPTADRGEQLWPCVDQIWRQQSLPVRAEQLTIVMAYQTSRTHSD